VTAPALFSLPPYVEKEKKKAAAFKFKLTERAMF
jgi:hypothetical protein